MKITKKAALVVGSTALVLGSAGAAGAQSTGEEDTQPAPTGGSITAPNTADTDGTTQTQAPAGVASEAPEAVEEVVEEVVVEAAPVAEAPAAPAAPAAQAAAPAAAAQQLPVTGGEATGLAALGAALVAGGGVLVWRSRGAAEA